MTTALLNDFCNIWRGDLTSNPKIAVKIMNASTLIDLLGENKLHGELKKLSEELTDDDNPILVIMKIK